MKVALAAHYRVWMAVLFPMTLGVGTAALWARALDWPCNVDRDGVTLRYRRRTLLELDRQNQRRAQLL